jgi:hypothetical protein
MAGAARCGLQAALVAVGSLLWISLSAAAQESPSTSRPPNLGIIDPIPEPPAEAPGRSVAPRYSCPSGYQVANEMDLKVCTPIDMTAGNCSGRAEVYSCGRNGTECCSSNQDNPCFAGAYACSVGPSPNGPRHACCLSR